jgi:hypothetical protein
MNRITTTAGLASPAAARDLRAQYTIPFARRGRTREQGILPTNESADRHIMNQRKKRQDLSAQLDRIAAELADGDRFEEKNQRTSLLSVLKNTNHKGDLLEQALAEESFEFWGDQDPWRLDIVPRPGATRLGQQRQAQEIAA